MGDKHKRAQSGAPLDIPAAIYNQMLDVIAAHDASRIASLVPEKADLKSLPPGTVFVKNNSGADVARFGVLGIDTPIFTPTDNLSEFINNLSLKGVAPTTASHFGKFVVALAPIASGKIGQAYISGVFPAKINVVHASHTHADVKDSDATILESGSIGALQILWKESSTGTKWAVVRTGGQIGVAWAKLVKTSNYAEITSGGYTLQPVVNTAASGAPAWANAGSTFVAYSPGWSIRLYLPGFDLYVPYSRQGGAWLFSMPAIPIPTLYQSITRNNAGGSEGVGPAHVQLHTDLP